MKREILEATFPGITGEYSESVESRGWWAAFQNKCDIYQILVLNKKFLAQSLVNGKYEKCNPIPLKAISLLAKYIDEVPDQN